MDTKNKKVLFIFKPEGITSLDALKIFRKKNKIYKDKKLGYAGTLDPLAEGLLLVLVEDENKKRKKYINLSKQYTFSFVIGFETDTYDILGIPKKNKYPKNIKEKTISDIFSSFEGDILQEYPMFSSKKVNGKALFEWALEGNNITPPKKNRTIFSIELKEIIPVNGKQLLNIITKKVLSVRGNFRQEKIVKHWNNLLKNEENTTFFIISAHAHVSSGTYIRSIVSEVGKSLKYGATTLSITRTHIGKESIYKHNVSI